MNKIKAICTKENLTKLATLFLIIQPLLDTYILFEQKTIELFKISPSTIIRLIFILIMGLMILFIIKSKKQLIGYTIYISLVIIYSVLHFYNATMFNSLTPGNFNYSFTTELFYIIRMLIPMFMIIIFSKIKFNTAAINKIVTILTLMTSGVIVFTNIFKISIGAYITKPINYNIFDWFINNIHASHTFYDTATRGYFSFANMISALLFGLTAMLFYQLFKKFNYKTILLIIIQMLAMFMLGTKVATFGFILSTIIMFIIYIFFCFIKKELQFNYKIVVFILIICGSWYLIYPKSPCHSRLSGVDIMEEQVTEKDKNENSSKIDKLTSELEGLSEEEKGERVKDFVKNNYIDFAIRESYITKKYPYQYDAYFWYQMFQKPYNQKTDNRYLTASILKRLKVLDNRKAMDDLFGITYSRMSNIAILERDILAQYYTLGIIGTILLIFPYLLIILLSGIIILLNYKKPIFKLKNISLIVCLGSGLVGAYYCGNVLDNLTFTIIYSFFAGQLIRSVLVKKEEKEINEKEINEKEITILALHLGVGGVEKYISSLCKMLENDYKINIISTYKVSEKPAFKFNKKINITYLIEDQPHKQELKESIKNKQIVNIIKYLLKNIKLYILRYTRNVKAIKNIKSKYVITTRIFHNNIVNNELDKNHIKIATEHNYHNNNKKYVNALVSSINNFDYFICVSNDLKEYYSSKVKNAKVLFIPNTIDKIKPLIKKDLNQNFISVGRFSQEKGFLDLIDVFNNIIKELPNAKLTLVGDGSEYEKINNKIHELKLDKNIKLTGYIKDDKKISKLYDNSSIYLMTSYTESFGIVLIEAMSHGVACIAFDSANGAKTLLQDNGILIKNRNKQEMAKQAIELIKNIDIWAKYSQKSYEYSKKYDISIVKEEWIKLLKGEI